MLRCLGSAQHLKSKFGTGYTMEVKLKKNATKDDWRRFENGLKKKFPGFELIEGFSDRKSYNVPKNEITSLAKTFKFLEKGELYSVFSFRSSCLKLELFSETRV